MMKKLTLMLLVIQSGFMMAQTTKTFVTVNGERVQMNPNSVNTANNGLEAQNGNVQLGGALIKKTTLVTTPSNTLALQGLQNGTNKDSVLVADSAGVLKLVPRSVFNTEGDNLGNHTATQDISLGNYFINEDGKDDWGLRFSASHKNAWFERTTINAKTNYVVRESNKKAKNLNFIVQTMDEGPFDSFGYEEVLDETSDYTIPKMNLLSLDDTKTYSDYYENTYGTIGNTGLVFNYNPAVMPNNRGVGLYYASGDNETNKKWVKLGDDLGNHTATQNLNIGNYMITSDINNSWGLKLTNQDMPKAEFSGMGISISAVQDLTFNNAVDAKATQLVALGEDGKTLKQVNLTKAVNLAQLSSGVLFSSSTSVGDIAPTAISLTNPFFIPFNGATQSPREMAMFETISGGTAFVAPKSGYYQFFGSVQQNTKSTFEDGKVHNFQGFLDLVVNSEVVASTGLNNQIGFIPQGFSPLQVSRIVLLKKGDKVMLRVGNNYRDMAYNNVKVAQGQSSADAMEARGDFKTQISSFGSRLGGGGATFEGIFLGLDSLSLNE